MTEPGVRERATALARELLERLGTDGIRELEVEQDGLRVRVVGASGAQGTAGPVAPQAASAAAAPAPDGAPMASVVVSRGAALGTANTINAPLTGIFYRSASPQSGPFVQEGSVVAVGDVIGLIEAMKLFNEIKSTAAGRVKRIVAENGKLVRAHAALIELE
ncbi:MAG: acetyl-CoA carboxylase biotin carboxyl carrier protein [Chloroflexota bacterium]|nr:acetyl-CoA carboxylase biotin carboxyl carrier protein [Chloroflexota bacterium]